jgi:hypothetical protein
MRDGALLPTQCPVLGTALRHKKGAVMAKDTKVTTVRLRNINSGAVVGVSEETAARLGAEWESADKKATQVAKKSTSTKK